MERGDEAIVRNWGRVAVLCGGRSTEREVSLISGRDVHDGLCKAGIDATCLDVEHTRDIAENIRGFDVVFIMLHGGDGEGGVVQELLDQLGVPYAGSGPEASALGMDKLATKRMLEPLGIRVPRFVSASAGDSVSVAEEVLERFRLPVVVKAVGHGASLGVRPARSREELLEVLEVLREEYGELFVEEFIHGREFSVPVLRLDGEDVALPVTEIVIRTDFNDFTTKYTGELHEMTVPAELDAQITEALEQTAVVTHQALGCWGFSRVDIMLGEDGIPIVLEINTVPGMTPHSIMPMSAAAMGLDYSRLVEQMLRSAFDRQAS